MAKRKDEVQDCAECGASVYPEHIESGKASIIEGVLRCPHCMTEYRESHHVNEERFEGQTTVRAPGESADFSPIAFDDRESSRSSTTELRTIGGDSMAGVAPQFDDEGLKRALQPAGAGATRCRTFHAKLNDGAVGYMGKHINDWADGIPDLSIKFATSTIGVWEGKKADAHLIITVFY